MKVILKYKRSLLGLFIGAIAGYLYYHFVGCVTGSCAITSHPVSSTIYGAVFGVFVFHAFKKEQIKP